MVSAGLIWTAVKVVAALTALVIGAVCVVVCYRDERAKELAKDGDTLEDILRAGAAKARAAAAPTMEKVRAAVGL